MLWIEFWEGGRASRYRILIVQGLGVERQCLGALNLGSCLPLLVIFGIPFNSCQSLPPLSVVAFWTATMAVLVLLCYLSLLISIDVKYSCVEAMLGNL